MNSIHVVFRFVQRFAEIDKKWGVNKSGRERGENRNGRWVIESCRRFTILGEMVRGLRKW